MKLICMGNLSCYIGRVPLVKTGIGRGQGPEIKCPACGLTYFTTATHLITYDESSKWSLNTSTGCNN